MVIRHASLPMSAIFENIEQSADQQEELRAYIQGPLWRFVRWYSANDFTELSKILEYTPERHPDGQLVSHLATIEGLATYPLSKQKDIMEAILCTLIPEEMMLLENCLTKNLKDYYPGIDWSLFDQYEAVK